MRELGEGKARLATAVWFDFAIINFIKQLFILNVLIIIHF